MHLAYHLGGWNARGGVREIIRIALPLILASAGNAINMFTDRMMLQWYSSDAMAAAFPAGLTSFALSCFFVGTVGYANSFVAQYTGAQMPERVGISVWQAIFMAFVGAAAMIPFIIFAPQIFMLFGHEARIQPLETAYFRIVSWGSITMFLMIAFSTFWGGRGKTLMIMMVNLLVTLCNVPLNYLMIFGNRFTVGSLTLSFPEMGIDGAAYATVLAGGIGTVIYAIAFFNKSNAEKYHTRGPFIDWALFRRLFRFGVPTGFQLALDLISFNIFIVLLGKINVEVLTAATVAFSINSLAFTPMLGVGQTVSILVGQGVGANDIPYAMRAVRSARTLTLGYMFVMGIFFVFYPDPIFRAFNLVPGSEVEHMTRVMLYFISAYLLFDGLSILYGSAIKGAGDTRAAMWIGIGMSWLLYAIPAMICYFLFTRPFMIEKLGLASSQQFNLWTMWSISVIYIICAGTAYFLRYCTGKWKSMKVIETKQNDHPRGAIPKENGVDTFLP